MTYNKDWLSLTGRRSFLELGQFQRSLDSLIDSIDPGGYSDSLVFRLANRFDWLTVQFNRLAVRQHLRQSPDSGGYTDSLIDSTDSPFKSIF